ncbi:hypothetical protein [Solimonas flava]|uniref:hypothetical protein n=1 Tax=Solimonas flava TaxID=415849 RepID=UPI0004104E53|nr:hypothetical protein [Solimonas flava]
MNAVASTLASDQPPRVLTSQLRDALAIANAAARQLHERRWRVAKQDLRIGSGKRPLLHIEPGHGALPLHTTQIAVRVECGEVLRIGKFGAVDVALPEGASL